MKKSIYQSTSKVSKKCFAETPPNKILIVPIDYAKSKHVVRFCFGDGSYIGGKELNVFNDARGIKFLERKINSVRKGYGISKDKVILCGEECPSYAFNFIFEMNKKYPVVRVNAREAKNKRSNTRTTSDLLALDGIARMTIEQKSYDIERCVFWLIWTPIPELSGQLRRVFESGSDIMPYLVHLGR